MDYEEVIQGMEKRFRAKWGLDYLTVCLGGWVVGSGDQDFGEVGLAV
jgi:hypothetical protein